MRYAKELGRELQRRRKAQGLTLKELAAKIPGSPAGPTLSTWEQATRDMSVSRLVDFCTALGVQPHEIVSLVDARVFGYHVPMVDVAALIRTRRPELAVARRWAQVCEDQGAPTVIHVPGYAVPPLALLSGYPDTEIAAALASVTVRKTAGGSA